MMALHLEDRLLILLSAFLRRTSFAIHLLNCIYFPLLITCYAFYSISYIINPFQFYNIINDFNVDIDGL